MGETNKQKKLRTFLGSLRLGLWGSLTVLETSHVFMSSLSAASPFLAVSSRVFMQPWLALERQGECGTPRGSPGFPQSPSLQTLMAHSSAVRDSIRSTQKKSQCWFPPQHPLVLSLKGYEGECSGLAGTE